MKMENTNSDILYHAALKFFSENITDKNIAKAFTDGITLGFKLAQYDGWKHVAPAWIEDLGK